MLTAAGCRSSSERGIPLGEECTAPLASVVTVPVPAPAERFRVLVFTRTLGFVHASVPVAIDAVRALGTATGFAVDATSDLSRFTDAGLAPYAVVAFISTGDAWEPSTPHPPFLDRATLSRARPRGNPLAAGLDGLAVQPL